MSCLFSPVFYSLISRNFTINSEQTMTILIFYKRNKKTLLFFFFFVSRFSWFVVHYKFIRSLEFLSIFPFSFIYSKRTWQHYNFCDTSKTRNLFLYFHSTSYIKKGDSFPLVAFFTDELNRHVNKLYDIVSYYAKKKISFHGLFFHGLDKILVREEILTKKKVEFWIFIK